MKNIKKLLCALLVTAFVLPVFAGCTNANKQTDLGKTPAETTHPEFVIEITSDEERIYESMPNYVFIPDDEMLGVWNAVDFVANIDDFDEGVQNYPKSELYWQNVEFFEDGTAAMNFGGREIKCEWTKGYMVWNFSQLVPSYTVKEVNGTKHTFVEWKSEDTPRYYVFKKGRTKYVNVNDDVRNRDLRNYDLVDLGKSIFTLWFNEKTRFPTDAAKMPKPENYQPGYILETGKNPGLGVRGLHGRGITGKGVNVAIIDQPLYIDSHPEYAGKITEYKDFDCQSESSMHGPGVVSLLVGETTGTAPGAKVYYAAAPSWTGDATYYADAIDWIVETNKNLPEGEKIRVISISAAPTPSNKDWTNGKAYLESVKRAKEAGILVLDCSTENGIIGACVYDFNNPEDVALCRTLSWAKKGILTPVQRTTAEEYDKGDFSYQYDGEGGLSWAIPYAAGVLAMGWEIRPELTADEIVKILSDTAYINAEGNRFIHPTAFIDYLLK